MNYGEKKLKYMALIKKKKEKILSIVWRICLRNLIATGVK